MKSVIIFKKKIDKQIAIKYNYFKSITDMCIIKQFK